MIQSKKIKKYFYKDYSLNKKKHFSLNEKNLKSSVSFDNDEDEFFFIKEINIENLMIKVFVQNRKYKKNIIFRFYDEKKKEVLYSRLLTNEILIKIFNDKRKEKLFLNLLKQTPNEQLIKKRLREIYNNVPTSIKEWIDEKKWVNDFPFNINIDKKISVLLVKEAKYDLLNSDNIDDYFDYYFDIYTEEKEKSLKKKMAGYNICNINLKDLYLKIYQFDLITDTPYFYNKYYYEKYCEEINITSELNDVIFNDINECLREEWEEFYNKNI